MRRPIWRDSALAGSKQYLEGHLGVGCYRQLSLVALVVGWAGVSARASAQPEGPIIDQVQIVGTVKTSETYVQSVIQTAAGDSLDRTRLDEDVRRLLQTGRFLTASADTITRDGQLIVVFEVAERPTVSAVRVVGNLKIKDKDLLELIPLNPGDPVDAFGVREGADGIEAAYREKGYSNVTVSHDADLLSRTGELLYTVEEGPRHRIRRIRFEGNTAYPDNELNGRIVSKTRFWVFRDGNFDSDQAEQDAATIQNFYRGQGFLDARASYRVEPGDKPDDLVLVFTIAEGTRYQVESVEVQGNTVFTDDDLIGHMRTQVGEVILQDELDRDVRDIQTRYGDIGHIYAQVRAVRVFSQTPGLVLVRVEKPGNLGALLRT
ncbi:MAG: POTRA domain-containing protein, partial [Phycisphaerae bacterium]